MFEKDFGAFRLEEKVLIEVVHLEKTLGLEVDERHQRTCHRTIRGTDNREVGGTTEASAYGISVGD